MKDHYYLLISLFCFAIALIYYRGPSRHKRNVKAATKIINKLREIDNPGARLSYLRKIDPFVFEELILTGFKSKGYKIKRNKRYTGDGGIDGRVKKDGKWYLVQAKRYSNSINPSHVLEFDSVIKKHKAAGGFFVHTGRTGAKSLEYKTDCIEFVSGDKLLTLIKA